MIKKAVILAAGRGTRLQPLTYDLPKPMIPLLGKPVMEYIVEHLARRISVAELAQVACLSPSHFHAQFKDSVGLTPHQYLLKTRLDRAARLLRESALPLIRIAEECGFSSQSALTTAMRRYLGLTPKRLRGAE